MRPHQRQRPYTTPPADSLTDSPLPCCCGRGCCVLGCGGGRAERSTIVKVACGSGHTVCLDAQGKVHVFGTNRYGQLGTLDKQVKKAPFCLREPRFFANQVVPRFEDI